MMGARFFLLAGEVSGDKLGAELMRGVKSLYPDCDWHGMGGPKMAAEGLTSSEDMSQLSIMGIGEVLSAYRRLHNLADRLVEQVMEVRPEAVFTIDSKAFSVRFAKKLRQAMQKANWSAPIIHMVAPTIWAWGPWRKRAFEAEFDALLCLFPFEPVLFNKAKINAAFIGHPLGYQPVVSPDKRQENIIGILPGSRRSEIRYILPDMLAAAKKIKDARPETAFLLPALPHLSDMIENYVREAGVDITIISDPTAMSQIMQQASICLAASGTVTLELALQAMPAVTCYRVSAINYLFMRGLYRLKDPILPHILLGEEVYPYFEQKQQTGTALAAAALNIMTTGPEQAAALQAASVRLKEMLTAGEALFQMQLTNILSSLLHPKP